MIYITDKAAKRHVGLEVSKPVAYWTLAAFLGLLLVLITNVFALIIYVSVVLWQ